MKRFKIGFLTLASALAILLTAATRPEVVKQFKNTDNYQCQTASPVDFKSVTYELPGGSQASLNIDASCPATKVLNCVKITASTPITDLDETDCNTGSEVICCIKVTQLGTPSPCPNPDYRQKYEVFCKADPN